MNIIGNISKAFKETLNAPRQRRQDRELFLGAFINGAWPLVRELVEKYPDAVAWRDEEGSTALHYAAVHRNAKIIHYLLDHGADIEAADKNGFRALHHAAQCAGGEPTAALLALLGRGASIEARNNNGTTPLMHAMLRNNPWNVRELIVAGADEKAADNAGHTPLGEARQMRGAAPMLYAAIEDGKAERLRRAEEERLLIQEEMRQAIIREAVASIGNGLDSDLAVMKPVRLAK